jgi:hypothetical protein
MSMVWIWNRIFGKPAHVEQEERAEKQARAPIQEVEAAPPPGRCKACGYEGPERYCPDCLADTMVVTRHRKRRRSNFHE